MRVLIFHGYLLRGTGSNVYNASLAPALAALGHDVALLCQDAEAGSLGWVNRIGRWRSGRLEVEELRAPEAGRGAVSAFCPPIGRLLPVYVADRYEGFDARPLPELTEEEVDRYLEANVGAVAEVAGRQGGVDAALANHLVMGPAVLARAGLGRIAGGPGFAVKVHGSALSYTVLPHPERFGPHAREGLEAASGVLVGSGHTAARLREAVQLPGLAAKTRLGPPGVDTDLFRPLGEREARRELHELASELRASGAGGSDWGRNAGRAAAAVERFAAADGPRVAFVGKLIVSKGPDLLLAAWPLVHDRLPGARLLVAGFGELGEALERLWAALASGDLGEARAIAARGRAEEGGPAGPLPILSGFLATPPSGYEGAAVRAAGSVDFAGRLEHREVGAVVPAADALAFPSTFPEAFGMVAAEAAAAGVLCVSAHHSGAAEVSDALAAALPARARRLVSFPLDGDAVSSIAERLTAWLGMEPGERGQVASRLREVAASRWSWEGVARGVLAAAAGELERLPPVPRVTSA